MLLRRDRVMVAMTVMLDVAFHGSRNATISAADIAEHIGLARRGMEPLLQTLSRAGLLESVRGPRGGYRLGRPARDIRLTEVAAALTEEAEAEAAEGPGGPLHGAVVEPLWHELEETVSRHLATLTLDDLLKRAATAGLRRPSAEPITFAI